MHLKLLILIVLLFKKYTGLPEYHQDDYDVKIERVEIKWYDTTQGKVNNFTFGYYNRTQKVFSGDGYLFVNSSTDVTGEVQFYKFASNEYRLFPMRVGTNLCKEYKNNNFNAKEILKKHSNVVDCPVPAGYYYVKNLAIEFSRCPPFIPRGRYKAVGKLYHNGKFSGEGHAYGEVIDKPNKWYN